MIKFFRRIRQKLLDEGNLKRYFIYAFGEILLIVIGILVAVQITNWNSESIDNREENRILTSFHDELVSNRSAITNNKLFCEGIKSAIMVLLNEAASSHKNLDNNSVDTLIGKISWFSTASTIEMATTDAIILGGKLSLISNENLRLGIIEWNRKVAEVQQDERQDYDAFNTYWMPFLQLHGYLPQISNSITEKTGTGENPYLTKIPLGLNSIDHSVLIRNREFQNVLLRRLWVMDDILRSYEELNPKLNQLISIVSSEIKN